MIQTRDLLNVPTHCALPVRWCCPVFMTFYLIDDVYERHFRHEIQSTFSKKHQTQVIFFFCVETKKGEILIDTILKFQSWVSLLCLRWKVKNAIPVTAMT